MMVLFVYLNQKLQEPFSQITIYNNNKASTGTRSVARFCSFLKLCKKHILSIIF